MKKTKLASFFSQFWLLLLFSLPALAQGYVDYGDDGGSAGQSPIFKLLTGGFGALVMVFMGLGGIASILITRGGNSRQGTPMMGVAMLAIAILLFAFRIGVKAGVFGHEYIEW